MNFLTKLSRVLTTVLTAIAVLVLVSCEQKVIESQTTRERVSLDPTLNRLLNMGFNKNSIVDKGNYYVVEGDMRFWKNSEKDKQAKKNQLAIYDVPLPSLDAVNYVTVSVASFPTTSWRNNIVDALVAAINTWNSVPDCRVNFYYTSGPSTNVVIQYDSSLPTSNYAQTDYPPGNNCLVGNLMDLNSNTQNLSLDQLKFLLIHELGHTIGLMHTDGQQNDNISNFQIPTTPITDQYSIMNSGTFFQTNALPSSVPTWSSFSGLSNGDQNAVKFLYPTYGGMSVTYNEDFSGYPITVRWTPSNFCEPSNQVKIDIYDGNNFVKSSGYIGNNGIFKFATLQLQSGKTYEFLVRGVEYPTTSPLSSSVEFTF